jgi:hypothetical protein
MNPAQKSGLKYYFTSKPATKENVKRGDEVFITHNGAKPEDERDARVNGWRITRVTGFENLYKGTITVSAWPYEVPLEAMRVKR